MKKNLNVDAMILDLRNVQEDFLDRYEQIKLDGMEKDSPSSVTPCVRSGTVNSVSVVSYGSYFAENVLVAFAVPRMVLSMNQPTQRSRTFSRASLSFRPVSPTIGSFALSDFTT